MKNGKIEIKHEHNWILAEFFQGFLQPTCKICKAWPCGNDKHKKDYATMYTPPSAIFVCLCGKCKTIRFKEVNNE